MALAGVEAAAEQTHELAAELAKALGVPLLTTQPTTKSQALPAGVKLIVNTGGLALGFMDKSRGKPYFVDFQTAAWKSRFLQPLARSHIFRRALGVHDEPVSVIDATAGLGQDAVLALTLGCEVQAVERSPVIAFLLKDGVERATREDETLRVKFSRFKVHQADSLDFLKTNSADVIYLDPMFEKPKKTAKSPKEMQLLQELLGVAGADDEQRLFAAAIAAARKRVVVKRPLKAKAINGPPAHSYKGQSIRYDVYVKPT